MTPMRLKFWSTLHAFLIGADAALSWFRRRLQDVRVFVWTRATRENLRTLNERQVKRQRFN